jgi:DNA replication licensing factor MCM5
MPFTHADTVDLQLKATRLMLQCRECNSTKRVVVKPGIAGVAIPRYCDAAQNMPGSEGCGSDPFHIVADGSEYVDQQQLTQSVQHDC